MILGQTKNVATREKLLRRRKSFKERSCRNTILYVATPKEDKRKVVETEKEFQRKILSRHRSVCRDTERRQEKSCSDRERVSKKDLVATPKEDNSGRNR